MCDDERCDERCSARLYKKLGEIPRGWSCSRPAHVPWRPRQSPITSTLVLLTRPIHRCIPPRTVAVGAARRANQSVVAIDRMRLPVRGQGDA
jgi:hypothetical protein